MQSNALSYRLAFIIIIQWPAVFQEELRTSSTMYLPFSCALLLLQGPSYRLNIAPPTAIAEELPVDQPDDLSDDAEDGDAIDSVNEYDRKLQNLSSEVGSLKAEV